MLLDNLKIENFRSLQNLTINKLGRVNLIVGKNNSGKSSLLEAIRIYAGRANPALLKSIATTHGEKFITTDDETPDRVFNEESELAFQAFFSGREIPKNNNDSIYIGTIDEKKFLRIEHSLYLDEIEEEENSDGELIRRRKRTKINKDDLFSITSNAQQALLVSSSDTELQGWIELNDNSLARRSTFFWDRWVSDIPLSHVPTQFLSIDYLAQLWDKIVLTPHEDSVKRALKIVEDDVEELAFIQSKSSETRGLRRSDRYERTAKIKLKGQKSGIPLTSMGDGMLRVLQLALTVFPARNGFLLIDEFENGLHWSVQEKIWSLIFQLATELNIQVFATSHSNDAIHGFARAANNHPQEGLLIKLSRNNRLPITGEAPAIAATIDEASLLAAANADIELR